MAGYPLAHDWYSAITMLLPAVLRNVHVLPTLYACYCWPCRQGPLNTVVEWMASLPDWRQRVAQGRQDHPNAVFPLGDGCMSLPPRGSALRDLMSVTDHGPYLGLWLTAPATDHDALGSPVSPTGSALYVIAIVTILTRHHYGVLV